GIDLENIVYYKDDTHYFVMTAKKQSLLKKGVILEDKADIESLLSSENVNRAALLSYAKEAANFSTNYRLPELEFALNHRDLPDVDMFDFTCMTRSENAALVREHNGVRLLLGLVGDCLVEPFWPLGTGVARGFLAAFDAAWMVRRWAAGTPPLEVLAERESIYQHLSQTSPDNTNKNISQYSIDPATRYPNINLQAIKASQVRSPAAGSGLGGRPLPFWDGDTCAASPAVSGDAYEELLSWCQASTAGYRGVAVTDFTTSWTNGLALCALVHRFRPDLVDFGTVDLQDPIQTHQMMLDMAEQELGIQPVLSSAEMATMAEPDRLGLITYLSQFYEAFKTSPEAKEVNKKPLSPRSTRGAILFLSKLQKSRNLTHKRAQDSAQKDAEAKRSRRDAEVEQGLDGDTLDNAHEPPQTTMMDPGQVGPCVTSVSMWVGTWGAPPARGAEPRAGTRAVQVNAYRLPAPPCLFPEPTGFPEPRLVAPLLVPTNPLLHLAGHHMGLDTPLGHFYCSLHYPSPPGMDLPQDEPPALPHGFLDLGEEEKYPTWKRTLTRRAREAQMKRFCKAQAIQRRLEEIEVTFRELEQQGIKLEKSLRDEEGTSANQKTQWMNQLLYLVQKKNSLMSEESDLMIAVQELKLEEQQWQLDQKLRCYMNKEESLKTPEDRAAEQEILVQLLEVVNKRNVLIHIQEEKRLSEL
ncbi:Protein-methionine sulfoxide oxidase mical3a, partial [Cuculus canorus]